MVNAFPLFRIPGRILPVAVTPLPFFRATLRSGRKTARKECNGDENERPRLRKIKLKEMQEKNGCKGPKQPLSELIRMFGGKDAEWIPFSIHFAPRDHADVSFLGEEGIGQQL
jgi:hypothetical protein